MVEGLFALVVSAAETCAAVTADRVDLVDEDDAGCVLLALLKEVADARSADADKHLDEVRTGDGEEGYVGFASDCAGEQGLAGARRSDEQDALGDAAPETLEFLGLAQKLDDLLELFLGFVDAGDILEGDLLLLHGEQPGARLAKAHGLVSAGLHLPHHEQEQAEQERYGQQRDDGVHPDAGRLILIRDGDSVLAEGLVKVRVVCRREVGRNDGVKDFLLIFIVRRDLGTTHAQIGNFTRIDIALELRIGHRFIFACTGRLGNVLPQDK